MEKGKLSVVSGDVTQPQRSRVAEICIIPHVCNDLGKMGAGVALALKKKWGMVEYFYLKSQYRLGECSWVNTDTETNDIIVVNMVAQSGTISKDNLIPIKYVSLIQCMQFVRNVIIPDAIKKSGPERIPVIHCPKFGSDLAGGNFDFILELIREIWLEHGIDVVVYEFGE